MITFLSLLIKIGLYTGLLGAAGFALHRVILGVEARRLIMASLVLLTVSVAARLVILNAELAGGFDRALEFSMFGWIWSSNKSQTLTYLAGVGTISIGIFARSRSFVGLGAVAMLFGVGLGGHVQGLDTLGLAPWVVSLHVAIAALWITAPVTLWPSQSESDAEVLRRLEAFSAIAVWSVPLLFAGGVWLGLQLTGSFAALLTTGYGLMLLA